MDDDGLFAAWFMQWKPARPDMSPIGWYGQADLKAAFNAGQAAAQKQVKAEQPRDRPKRN